MIPLALDTETALIRPGLQAPPLACLSVSVGGIGLLYDRVEGVEIFKQALDSNGLIIGHTIAYDLMVLCNERPELFPAVFDAYEQDRITDTEIRAKLLDIAAGVYRRVFDEDESGAATSSQYNLEDLSWRLLRRRLDKNTWRLRYGELLYTPIQEWPEGARVYPVEDARATFDIWTVQEPHAAYLQDQYRQARAAFWLKLMSAWGIHTDAQGVLDLARETQRDYDLIATDLRAIGLLRPDRKVKRRSGVVETVQGARDTKLARAKIVQAYAQLGKPHPTTDTGLPCLDDIACQDSLDLDLEKYARLTKLGAVLSKDVPMLAKGVDVPIHSFFEVLKETGRTGSSGPNLQNLRRARGIRECFIPRCHGCGAPNGPTGVRDDRCIGCGGPAYVFVSADFGGLELNTLAEVCYTVIGYSDLGDALNKGLDPHLLFAEDILGRPYDELKAIRKGADHKSPEYQLVDDARQTGKVGNFGFPGGLGAAALCSFALSQYNVRLTEPQAKDLKKIWLRRWREAGPYFRWINKQVKGASPLICHLFSNRYRGGVGYTDACNSYFQGLGADVAKAAGWLIARACYVDRASPLYGFRIVLFVHDEFVLEGPQHRAHDAAIELSRLMVQASRPWLPHLRPIEAPPVIMRRYSRDAKALYGADGRLIPWAA